MRISRGKIITITLFIVIFTTTWIACISKICSYLSKPIPGEGQIAIVEGWLSPEDLEEVARVIHAGNYQLVITTGIYFVPEYTLFTNGTLGFSRAIAGWDSTWQARREGSIVISGSPAGGQQASFEIIVNETIVSVGFANNEPREINFRLPDSIKIPASIGVRFTNDAVVGKEDRNLRIHGLVVGDRTIYPRTRGVHVDWWQSGTIHREGVHHPAHACLSADILKELLSPGIPVMAVPTRTRTNRTFKSAMEVEKWLRHSGLNDFRTMTLFSSGIHARRSYLAYKKALGRDIDLYLYTVNAGDACQNHDRSRLKEIRQISRELLGCMVLYAWFWR